MSHLPYFRFFLVTFLLTSALPSFSVGELLAQVSQENTEQTKRPNPNDEIKKHIVDVKSRPLYFVEVYKDKNKEPKPLVIFVHGTPDS